MLHASLPTSNGMIVWKSSRLQTEHWLKTLERSRNDKSCRLVRQYERYTRRVSYYARHSGQPLCDVIHPPICTITGYAPTVDPTLVRCYCWYTFSDNILNLPTEFMLVVEMHNSNILNKYNSFFTTNHDMHIMYSREPCSSVIGVGGERR